MINYKKYIKNDLFLLNVILVVFFSVLISTIVDSRSYYNNDRTKAVSGKFLSINITSTELKNYTKVGSGETVWGAYDVYKSYDSKHLMYVYY